MSEQDATLITCIVPRGRGLRILDAVRQRWGIVASNVHHARGVGRSTPLGRRGFGEAAERDVVSVVVAAELSDEVFAYVYFEGRVGEPHGGIVYMRPLLRAKRFELPQLPEEH